MYGAMVVMMIAYIGWACRPRKVEVEWHYRLTSGDRAVAEQYLSKHPLTPYPMSRKHVWHNLIHPYNAIDDTGTVTLMQYSDGNELIQIDGPNKDVSLRRLEDGAWEVVEPFVVTDDDAIPLIGRMFEKRVKWTE